jgi:acyl-CoA reductase-like NAD-dependent aldehyde dehydrogenase
MVQSGIYERFVAAMAEKVRARTLGNPLSGEAQQGPQVNRAQMESVLQFVRDGIKGTDNNREENASRLTRGRGCTVGVRHR